MLLLALTSCRKTQFSDGFSNTAFASLVTGLKADNIYVKLGSPILMSVYDQRPDKQLVLLRYEHSPSLIRVKEFDDSPNLLVLDYSFQSHPHISYRKCQIHLKSGVIVQILDGVVDE